MFDPATRSKQIDALFGDASTYSRMLDVECALAKVQSRLGIIPSAAAKDIESVSSVDVLNKYALQSDFEKVGFPVVGLVRRIVRCAPEDSGQYAHWGSTTQDIMDTALILGLKVVTTRIGSLLRRIQRTLTELASTHADTLMVGRSQLQHAVPVTFGYKVSGWVCAIDIHNERMTQLLPRLMQVQFGGAAGSLSALHPQGATVRAALASELGLQDPDYTWHTHRESLVEFVSLLGLLTGTCAKIAGDVVLMAQTEIGELEEPDVEGRGVSTAMPQKRNPVLAQQIQVAARAVRGIVPMMLDAMIQDHERGTGKWQSEWALIPDACSHAIAVLERMEELASGLQVNSERMESNIGHSHQFVYAESVMMALAKQVGRQCAHELVDRAVEGAGPGMTFSESLLSIGEIAAVLSKEELANILSGELHRSAGRAATEHALRSCERAQS